MKSRKMYAPRGWEGRETFCLGDTEDHWSPKPIPVLVTDATDMPDFKPGDRVRMPNGDELDVEALYRDRNGGWCVAAYRANSTKAVIVSAVCLTKLPRETSVLLRVRTQAVLTPDLLVKHMQSRTGVLEVRVEDPDAKGGEKNGSL